VGGPFAPVQTRADDDVAKPCKNNNKRERKKKKHSLYRNGIKSIDEKIKKRKGIKSHEGNQNQA